MNYHEGAKWGPIPCEYDAELAWISRRLSRLDTWDEIYREVQKMLREAAALKWMER